MSQSAPKNANELSHVLAGLRAELATAQQAGTGQDVHFLMGDVEIELQVATTGEAKVEGGIKFWVLNFGAEAKGKDEQTQKIKIKLKPVDAAGNPLLVSRQDTRG